jgi:glycosyltransferase involved in cell wall biosynthesis
MRVSSDERCVKLIFVNRYFHPDHSATSQMLSDLAFALADQGQAVCVITSRQRYDAPTDQLPARETVKGVSVYRLWTSRFGRANLVGRAIDYATFYAAAAWRLWRLARRGDVVIAKTDPPMLSLIAAPVCRLRRALLVNWLQDIFPETAQALGVGGRGAKALYWVLRWFRDRSLRAAHTNVVLGERMAERICRLGISPERVRVIANWADGSAIEPIDREGNALRAAWGLTEAFVVGYSGNLGRAHEIETLLEAMSIIEDGVGRRGATPSAGPSPSFPAVRWLFIGSGALFEPLKAEVARGGLTSVHFEPYQPRELLAESLSAADVHLVSLRPELEGLIVPSKFYGICAAGRPTLFIGDGAGEIGRLIGRHDCGRSVCAGDGSVLAQTILELAADPITCRSLGQRARQAFDAEFDKVIALAWWDNLLLEICRSTAVASWGARSGERPGVVQQERVNSLRHGLRRPRTEHRG